MFYFVTRAPHLTVGEDMSVVDVTTDHAKAISFDDCFVTDRWSLKTFHDAEEMAAACNVWAAKNGTGQTFIPTDAGANVSPRYDVQELPKVGDEVSYAFNGDYYPCGKVTTISSAPAYRRIVAADENGTKRVFWRVRQRGSWRFDQTWSLVRGHIKRLNPEF